MYLHLISQLTQGHPYQFSCITFTQAYDIL